MLPIYRIRDGFDQLHKNEAIFDQINTLLQQNAAVVVFPEGDCELQKSLRPLKKGTARMAFRAYHDGADVQIIPVGLNYTYHNDFRSEVMIDFGEPFSVSEFQHIYAMHQAKGLLQLNRKMKATMKSVLVEIEQAPYADAAENLLILFRNEFPSSRFPIIKNKTFRQNSEQNITQKTKILFSDNTPEVKAFFRKLELYFSHLKKEKTTDKTIKKSEQIWRLFGLITLPLWLLKPIFWFIQPIAQYFAVKLSRSQTFYIATFFFGISFGFYLLLGMISFPILALALSNIWLALGIISIFYVLLYFTLIGSEIFNESIALLNFFIKDKKTRKNLRKQREFFIKTLKTLDLLPLRPKITKE